ncbi:MAG: hypothetical protein H7267_04865 [Sandarakinorhabdus sp.]|nr:hypothetical protein [Sandarakinorhabdus sp.]
MPVVIVFGGSEGGSFVARTYAPMLAAQGFAALGLPYYSPGYDPKDRLPGLPTSFTDIPGDRLAEVKKWIDAQPDLDGRRIAIWGVSKGGEFAMLAASRLPWLTAVVSVVPSDVVWEGWGGQGPATASFSWDGKALPFVPYLGVDLELARVARGERMEMRRPNIAGRAANPERVRAATIPVENFAGEMLVIGGDDDRVWPSAGMARAIAERRDEAGRTTALNLVRCRPRACRAQYRACATHAGQWRNRRRACCRTQHGVGGHDRIPDAKPEAGHRSMRVFVMMIAAASIAATAADRMADVDRQA